MITADEYRALEHSRDRFIAKAKDLQHQIDLCTSATVEADAISARIPLVQREIEDEAQHFRTESAQLRHQIEKLGGRSIHLFDHMKTSMLNGDEHKLISAKGHLAELMRWIDDTRDTIESSSVEEEVIEREVLRLSQICGRFDRIVKRFPSFTRIICQVVDLESEYSEGEGMREGRKGRVRDVEGEVRELERMRGRLEAELEEVTGKYESVMVELKRLEAVAASKFAELKAVGAEIEVVSGATEKGFTEARAIRREIDDARRDLQAFEMEYEGLERTIEEELQKPKVVPDLGGIRIAKKKTLIGQLEHKLEEARATIMIQQAEGQWAALLRTRLANEIRERGMAQAEYTRGRDKMVRLRTLLELKETVLEELGKWCPRDSKVKVRPGLDELLFVFDVALTRNRDMAGNLQVLTNELNALEAEKRCLAITQSPPGQESEGMNVIYHVLNLV
jgi:chromosome segregation ATPase